VRDQVVELAIVANFVAHPIGVIGEGSGRKRGIGTRIEQSIQVAGVRDFDVGDEPDQREADGRGGDQNRGNGVLGMGRQALYCAPA